MVTLLRVVKKRTLKFRHRILKLIAPADKTSVILRRLFKGYFLFLLFFISWFFVIVDVFFSTYSLPLTWNRYLIQFLHTRLPFQLPLILYVGTRVKSSLWQKTWAWQTWAFPTSLLMCVSVFTWQFNPDYLYQTSLLGFNWNWAAVLEWSLLFILQLYLYQRCNTQNFVAFTLSYLGVFVGSFIYEVAFFAANGALYDSAGLTPYIFCCIIFAAVLYKQKFTPKLWNVTLFFPIILLWMFYFSMPTWVPRLSVFPFFLSIPTMKLLARIKGKAD